MRFGRHWPVTVTEAMAERRGLRTDIDTSWAARKAESGSCVEAGDVKRELL